VNIIIRKEYILINIDVTKLPLNPEQMNMLKILGVPLFHEYARGNRYISRGYWYSIKPELQEVIIRVLDARKGDGHE
jgi:hypothetical protein